MPFFNAGDLDSIPTHTKARGKLGQLKKFQQGYLGQLGGYFITLNILVRVSDTVTVKFVSTPHQKG
jgi:hypothetical protein